MNPLELTTLVNTLAVAIADSLNQSDLALASAIFTQIGDTLATIAVMRQRATTHPSTQGPAFTNVPPSQDG